MAKKEASPGDFFSRLSNRTQHIICLSVLFIIPFILFFQSTLGGKELQRHDTTQWRAGAESIIEYREEFGEEPLWATNMFAGMPAYVISLQNQVPHLDFLYGKLQKIYPSYPYWLMFFGMYSLLIVMGFRPLTSLIGSLAFGLTSYFSILVVAGHASKLNTLGYVPWMFIGYWKIINGKNYRLFGLLIFMVAVALQIRAGHPQISYYFAYLLAGLWVFDSWKLIREKAFKNWGYITGLLLIGGVIGLLGNAERILTLREYAEHSIRGGSALKGTTGLDTNYAFAWSQGIAESLTLLIPDLFGGASTYWGPKSVTGGPHYLGAFALPFILIALIKAKQKIIFVFFSIGTLGLLFSWGSNFSLLNEFAFNVIPFFSKFRAPETWLVLTVFCYIIVAIYGIEWTIDAADRNTLRLNKLYQPLGITIAIFALLFVFANSLDFKKNGEIERISAQIAQQNQVSPQNPQVQQRALSFVENNLVPEREKKAKEDVLRLGLFIFLTFGILYALITKKISASTFSLALIFLVSIDLIQVDKRYIPERSFVSSNVNPEKYLESQRRDLDTFIQENISEGVEYEYRVLPLLDNPFSEARPSYFYPSLGGYTAARLSVYSDVVLGDENLLFSGPFGINLELLRLLNTKYVTYQPGLNISGLTPVFNSDQGVVYEVEGVLPKAFFVDSVITATDPETAFNYLRPDQLDLENTAVVEGEKVLSGPDSLSTAEVTFYTGPEITIEINRTKPGFLVLSELYYPDGWEAELNGEPIPIYKTDYMLRGFQIPPGNHILELDFRPDSFHFGVKLSWFSFMCQFLLACMVGITYFKNRNGND